jgi:hypothetical protein
MKRTKICPQCGFEGSVVKYFGTRVINDIELAQSWCIECRGKGTNPKPAQAKTKTDLPASRVALMRLYKQRTGDKKIRSSHYMRQKLS